MKRIEETKRLSQEDLTKKIESQERTWAGFVWQTGEGMADLSLRVGLLFGAAFLLSYGCKQIQDDNISMILKSNTQNICNMIPEPIVALGTSVVSFLPSLHTIEQLGFGVAATASIAQAAPVINQVVDPVLDPAVKKAKGVAQETTKMTATLFYTYVSKPSYEYVSKPMYNMGAAFLGAKKA